MKILFLFRDSYDAKYILNSVDKKNVSQIILEKGTRAKKNKLKKLFKKSSFFNYPKTVLDITGLIIYSSIALSFMKKKLGLFSYPQEKIVKIVDDANDSECIAYIKKYKPDVIFIYGTAILKEKFLQSVTCPIFNIHSGILPRYRNVHSDFWAYMYNDLKNIGVTIIYLDAGIDSGDIALQKKILVEEKDSLIDIKVKNLQVIPQLIKKIIAQERRGAIKRVKQNKEKSHFYPTPHFIDIMKFIKKTV
jgi:folate-dependent phosphoribosylglycinamide formyltransferase PurN